MISKFPKLFQIFFEQIIEITSLLSMTCGTGVFRICSRTGQATLDGRVTRRIVVMQMKEMRVNRTQLENQYGLCGEFVTYHYLNICVSHFKCTIQQSLLSFPTRRTCNIAVVSLCSFLRFV